MGYEIRIEASITLTDENIDDIMRTALEGGITYWCRKAKVVGDYLGEYAHEQIARGGKLILFDAESSDKWELTRDKFLSGFKQWFDENSDAFSVLDGGEVDCGSIDAEDADAIVQYALFGELVFG